MKKSLSSALVLLALLALTACDNTPQEKMESAKTSAANALDNIGAAASDTADALEQQANETLGRKPTVGDHVQDAADQAADALKNAGEHAKEALDKE